MSEGFKPFDAALLVRDALLSCSCCADEAEGHERYSASHDLLEWVVQAQAEIAGLRALTSGSAPSRAPLSDAERAKAYRARKRVTKTVTNRHDNRHAAVTPNVTPASLSDSPSDLSISSDSLASSEEEREIARAESVTESVTKSVTPSVTRVDMTFDARLWEQWAQANRRESMGAINHDAIRSMRPALSATESVALTEFRKAADAYLADCKQRGRRGHFAFLAKDIGTWLQPTGTPAPGPVSPARRLLNPPPTKAGAA